MHNDYIIVMPAAQPEWLKRDLRENRNELRRNKYPTKTTGLPKLFGSLEEYIND